MLMELHERVGSEIPAVVPEAGPGPISITAVSAGMDSALGGIFTTIRKPVNLHCLLR